MLIKKFKLYTLLILSLIIILLVNSILIHAEQIQKITSQINKLSNQEIVESNCPIIDSIHFTGNNKLSSQQLFQVIILKPNDPVDEIKIMQSMLRIADSYKKIKLKVTITPILGKVINHHISIQFNIHENDIMKNY